MATKTNSKPTFKAKAKAKAKTATKPETTKKPSQAAMIVDLLTKKVEPSKIVEKVKAACGGNPTVGYVRWLGRKNNLIADAS